MPDVAVVNMHEIGGGYGEPSAGDDVVLERDIFEVQRVGVGSGLDLIDCPAALTSYQNVHLGECAVMEERRFINNGGSGFYRFKGQPYLLILAVLSGEIGDEGSSGEKL